MRDESTLFRDLIAFALEWKERLTLISTPYLSLIVRTSASHQGDEEKEATPHTHSLTHGHFFIVETGSHISSHSRSQSILHD